MNAWYFTFEFPPDFGGGLSTYMKVIAECFQRRDDSSLVVFALSRFQSGLVSSRFIAKNVLLITINPMRSRETESLGYWVNVSRLFDTQAALLLQQIDDAIVDIPRPDYMEFADGFGIGSIITQQKLCKSLTFAAIPIVVNLHTPTFIIDRMNRLPVYKLPRYWTSQMELQAIAGADIVLAPSQAILKIVKGELERTGARLPPSRVLHNPIPQTEKIFSKDITDLDHFYMASRMVHWKGVETAIKAFSCLWDEGNSIPFLIYGEDSFLAEANKPYSTYISEKYRRYLDQSLIRFMGKCSRDKIDAYSRTAFAQVHPSHFDNFPYSVLEGMNEGTICIASMNGGIAEIGDNQSIFLVDVQDISAFACVLRKVVSLTSAERVTIQQNARDTVQKYCSSEDYLIRKEAIVLAHLSADSTSIGSALKRESTTFPFLSPARTDNWKSTAITAGRPELSVVIPYFNMGAYIQETIESIRNSSVSGIEIILINDGSTDRRSIERLASLSQTRAAHPELLRVLHVPNGGVANARNIGVRSSSAPFVALLDADDLVRPDYYEKALRILNAYENVSFVGCWIEDYNQDGRIRNWATWNAEPPIQLLMNQTNCQSLVYRREAFLSHGQHDPDLNMYLDDWEGVISLIAGGHRGVMIPEPLFKYRIRKNSIFRSSHDLWDLNFEKIVMKHEAVYKEWGADVAAFLNVNGPNRFYHIAGKESALRK